MSISVTFGSTSLPSVRSVQKSNKLLTDIWNDNTNNKSVQSRELVIDGIVFHQNYAHGPGAIKNAFNSYNTLEAALRAEGLATLTFGGVAFTNTRLASINFEKYSNNPAIFYTATFATDLSNSFAETVTLQDGSGTTTFNPIPSVEDEFVRQDPTITWSTQTSSAAKRIRLKGRFRGTSAEISTYEDEIKSRCTTDPTITLTIPTGIFTVKCQSFKFSTPEQVNETGAKEYDLEFFTEKNYSIESENLPNTPVTYGSILFSVLKSYSSQIGRINNNGVYEIDSETLNVSGEIYFSSFAAAEAYRANIASSPNTPDTITSITGKTLNAISSNYSAPIREGRDTSGNQRYVLSCSLSFEWEPRVQDINVSYSENIFGITWFTIASKNYGGTVDFCGLKTQDTLSVSGKVSSIPSISVGNSYTVDGKLYYVTGVSYNGRDKQGRYDLTVSGRTLDTLEQAIAFLAVALPVSGQVLNEMTSYNKSATYKYNSLNGYRITSVNVSISGNMFVGNGDANGLLTMINEFSQFRGGNLREFRVTNISVGNKQSFVDPSNCQIGFKQSVSVSYTINFEPDGNTSGSRNKDATIIEDEAVEIQQIRNKYTQIQIPGGSLIFKKTGLEPGKVKFSVTRRRVGGNGTIFFDYPDYPSAPSGPSEMFLSDSRQSATSTTRKSEVEYTVIKGTVSAITPSSGKIVSEISP